MRHEILLPIEVNSDMIEERLNNNAFDIVINKLDEKFTKEIEETLPKKWKYYSNQQKEIDWRDFLEDVARKFMEEHKEEVLEAAVKEVVASIKRTKAYKEAVFDATK